MLTGTGIQIGNAVQFGASIRFPRALASDGTTVWLFDGNKGYSLAPATGIATRVGNVTGFNNSETLVRSGTYHNNQVLVYGHSQRKIQVFDTSAGTLTDWHSADLSYAGSETGTPQPWGIASLNGVLYALDTNIDALYSISTTGVLTRIGTSSLFGLGALTTRGFTAYRGQLIAKDFTIGKIFSIDPATGIGTIIGETNTLPDTGFEALVEFDGSLYGAGSGTDAWYRLYDVLWDEMIADLEVDEGDSATWSLSGISQDAASFALQGTPLSWLSVSGTNLAATTAPDVNADQNHDVQVRATRDGINVDETLRVVVAAALVLPTWQASIPAISVNEGNNHTTDTEPYLTDATGLEFAPSHTARSWLSVSGFDLVITGAPDVTADTDYDVVLRATNSDGHRDKTLTVRVIAEAAPPPPLNPPTFTAPAANYEVNERADDSIDATEFFTGHTSLAFRSGYSAPSWLTISGVNVVITDAPDVLEDTDFTVPLTATNGDGSVNGSIMISVQQIDPAPVFGTPNRFDIDEGSSSVFDLSGDLQNTESLAYQSGYSAPSWLRISGLTLVITNAEQVSQDTDFDVLLAAESTKTAATADRTVTIRVRDVAVPPPPPPADAVLDMTVNPASVTAGNAATVTFSFDKAVGEFTDADVNVSAGATKGTLTDEGNNVWTLPVTAPSAGNGTVTVSVGADVVTPGNNADSVQFAYTAPPPPVQEVPALSSEPIEVAVELTPTTALITWKAPTNGAFLTEYEISYAEGASPGTDWIPTESLSTRFVVKRLKRGTQYTWQVRGVTDNGAGDASHPVTQNTPIASLHNALFFKECVNYFDDGARISEHGNPSNIIRAVGDNNYQTFTREKDMVLNIAVNGQPTRVDAIFVKGIDIEGHSAEPTGGTGVGYNNRMMPLVVKNWEGTEVSTVVAGFQHDLYLLDQHFTATSVRLTFTGANAKITEIMLVGVRLGD